MFEKSTRAIETQTSYRASEEAKKMRGKMRKKMRIGRKEETDTLAATHCDALRRTATHCNTLQHTATHCNKLQHTATHCDALQHIATHEVRGEIGRENGDREG